MKSVYIFLIAMMGTSVSFAGERHQSHGDYHHDSYDLPGAVIVTLGHRYNHYDLIHSERIYRPGRLSFDVIIQHRWGFAKVTIGSGGHFYGESYYDHYPLANHYCDESCGFQYQHYQNGQFSNYDPYYGCDYHIGLIINRYPRYAYRPYYGYGSLYYHPGFRLYKRFKHYDPYYGRGYHVHRRPFKYYSPKYKHYGHKKYGYGGNNHGKHYSHGHRKDRYYDSGHNGRNHRGSGTYGRDHRGSGSYDRDFGRNGNYQKDRKGHKGSGNYNKDRRDSGGSGKYKREDKRYDRQHPDRIREGNRGNQGRERQYRGSREELDRKRGKEKFERPGGNSRSRNRVKS